MPKFLLFLFAVVIFASCKKEVSQTNGVDEPIEDTSSNKKLVKMHVISGANNSDTATSIYTYNSLGKLETEMVTMQVVQPNGSLEIRHFFTRYYRDALGRIIKVARKGPYSDNGNNTDTLYDIITYASETSNRITSMNNGARVYTYNAAGQVTGTSEYMPWPNPTDPVRMVVYHIYSYDDNGNIKKREEFTDQDGNGVFDLNITYKFEYDSKRNPLHSTDDALLEWRWGLMSPNNILKQTNIIAAGGVEESIISMYEYRADNLPHSGGYNLGPDPIIVKYYYQ